MMWKSFFKRIRFTPLHIILWILVWLFYVYFFSYGSGNTVFIFWFSTSLLPITILTTYTVSYILIPKYLIARKYVAFGIYLAYTIICSLFLILIITFVNFIFLSDFNIMQMPLLTRNFVFVLILVYLVVGLVCFIQLLYYNNRTVRLNTELEHKLLEGQLILKQKELHYLKQQIHPHFLFNTLNTIYGFALKQSKETPELILKLSDLLDYILHQIEKPRVTLNEEIKHIDAYIGLERVRFRDKLRVNFTKDIQNDVQIPPMLFIAFVENAFKHGTPINGFLNVEIKIHADTTGLYFSVKNTMNTRMSKTQNHGLGIENSIKRLDSLFPDAYTLQIKEEENWYNLDLNLNLNKI